MATFLEPLAVMTETVGTEVADVFGLNIAPPMFLPGGGINPAAQQEPNQNHHAA
tara:strand:+ start:21 stop:182 length:162 start_codon:yes stop_codon:yes gene_type:complete